MATDRETRVGERRPGGRSGRVRAAVLDATVELLAETGYEALSIEAVADRAGVHKTTVYRRWPAKADLVAEAARSRSRDAVPLPDTGTLEGDLRALARAVAAAIGSEVGGAATRALVAATATSPDVGAAAPAFWAERLDRAGVIVDRAVARGELPAGTDARLLVETLIGPLYVRLLLTGEPITVGVADRAAALVSAGARRA